MWPATFALKYSLSKKWWTVANKNIIIIIIDIIFILQVETRLIHQRMKDVIRKLNLAVDRRMHIKCNVCKVTNTHNIPD